MNEHEPGGFEYIDTRPTVPLLTEEQFYAQMAKAMRYADSGRAEYVAHCSRRPSRLRLFAHWRWSRERDRLYAQMLRRATAARR